MKNYDFLIDTAKQLMQSRYCKAGHHTVVSAALLTKDGKVYSALNVGTYQPSIATCAEIVAIGMALKDNADFEIEAIVCVRDADGYIITPCGKCREYIADYSDGKALVCVPKEDGQYEFLPISKLLPNKYVKKI
ncbi:MAG: cytidine deaminase [Alphaproteobacteria bacterium]